MELDVSTVWFEVLKPEYINELQFSCSAFCNSIIPIAIEKWESEEQAIHKKWDKMLECRALYSTYLKNPTQLDLPNDFVVPLDYEADLLIEEYSMKFNSYLRMVGLALSNIMMIWEQQLFDYLAHLDTNLNNDYRELLKNCHEYTTFNLDEDYAIKELRHLVNVIKHGKNTNSYKWLDRHKSKFLKNSNQISCEEGQYVFVNISAEDIQYATKYLISFWETIVIRKTSIEP